MADVHRKNLRVIASGCAGFDRLYQPFCDQALGKLTLCIFKTENRPPASGVERAFELVLIHFAQIRSQATASQLAI